jgi:hypothetical protein
VACATNKVFIPDAHGRTMRSILTLVAIGILAGPGCVAPAIDLEGSLAGFYEAHCEGRAEDALAFVANPFYRGREGSVAHDELRSEIASDSRPDGFACDAMKRFDFERMRTLSPAMVESEFDVSIDEQIPDYRPDASDVYVLVPARPSPSSDDPLQGFWRPAETHWEFVATFED